MPTYQYRCTECATELETVQKFTDPPLTVCPECGAELRKVFSPVGVVFKGSGFYATDSRSKGKANAAKPGDTSKPGDTTKPDTSSKTDTSSSTSATKPAEKTSSTTTSNAA